MNNYFVRRLLLIIPTFIGITLVVFAVTRIVPGGPIERAIMQRMLAQEGKSGTLSPLTLRLWLNLLPFTVLTNRGRLPILNGWEAF